MASIGIVMSNMLIIYVATAGIIMRNMLSNYVKVCTSLTNLYTVLQTQMHPSLLPLIMSLTLHGQDVCSIFTASLGCY